MFLPSKLSYKSLGLSLFLLVFVLFLSVFLWLFLKQDLFLILMPISIAILAAIQFELYFRTQSLILQQNNQLLQSLQVSTAGGNNHYQQIEALFSIFKLLPLKYPLPPMRNWAISPDFAALIITLIYERRPQVIVETGSGVSTLITAYCLKAIGQGKIISLEHDEKYAQISMARLQQHGLQDIATIFVAPLKETAIGNDSWLWYDIEPLKELLKDIDMLIIDGPPGMLQKLSRYPALPILFDHMNGQSIVVLDDADREDEREIVERWTREFDGCSPERVQSEKGAVVIDLKK